MLSAMTRLKARGVALWLAEAPTIGATAKVATPSMLEEIMVRNLSRALEAPLMQRKRPARDRTGHCSIHQVAINAYP